ncbi:MAG: RDD family protein, partial [Planctomycetota bacterium]
PSKWVEGLGGAWSLLAVLLMGLILGTVTEWLLGRSLGKSLMGCGVVSVRPGRGARLSFVQALGRNAFKWALAPGAAMLLVDASGRHRGDVVTGTAVVVRARNPQDSDET